MPARGFVLIETGVGKARVVARALRDVEGVHSVDVVTGPYDVIAVVEGEDLNAVGDLITTRVHLVDGITRTVTCLAVRID